MPCPSPRADDGDHHEDPSPSGGLGEEPITDRCADEHHQHDQYDQHDEHNHLNNRNQQHVEHDDHDKHNQHNKHDQIDDEHDKHDEHEYTNMFVYFLRASTRARSDY